MVEINFNAAFYYYFIQLVILRMFGGFCIPTKHQNKHQVHDEGKKHQDMICQPSDE